MNSDPLFLFLQILHFASISYSAPLTRPLPDQNFTVRLSKVKTNPPRSGKWWVWDTVGADVSVAVRKSKTIRKLASGSGSIRQLLIVFSRSTQCRSSKFIFYSRNYLLQSASKPRTLWPRMIRNNVDGGNEVTILWQKKQNSRNWDGDTADVARRPFDKRQMLSLDYYRNHSRYESLTSTGKTYKANLNGGQFGTHVLDLNASCANV